MRKPLYLLLGYSPSADFGWTHSLIMDEVEPPIGGGPLAGSINDPIGGQYTSHGHGMAWKLEIRCREEWLDGEEGQLWAK